MCIYRKFKITFYPEYKKGKSLRTNRYLQAIFL